MLTSPLQHGRSSFYRTNRQHAAFNNPFFGILRRLSVVKSVNLQPVFCKNELFHIILQAINSYRSYIETAGTPLLCHTPVSARSCLVYPVTRCPNINKYSDTIIGSIHWSVVSPSRDMAIIQHFPTNWQPWVGILPHIGLW